MIIAIDGPSGTGKSTVAKEVAKRLKFTFFDTGAMYRAFAWQVVQEKVDPSDPELVVRVLPKFHFEILSDPKGGRRYLVGGEDVSEAIREVSISSVASQIAIYPEVRAALVKIQRNFGSSCDAVFEGRDMGTVVFPDADVKIFLTAKAEIRAERRYQELIMKFPHLKQTLDVEQVRRDIEKRDQNDTTRSISPLKQALDAILIDTSHLTVDEVASQIVQLCKEKTKRRKMKISYWLVYWLARLFFIVFFRLKIYGLNRFRRGSGIIACNHSSNYDPPVLSISCPEEVHFLAKESLFRIPLLGKLIRVLNAHPVARGASDTQTFKTILQVLKEGKKIILFPEGKRSIDGNLQSLERGLSFLVQKSHATIFPAYIQGTFEAWPSNKRPKIFGKIVCVFGTPIEWKEFEHLEKKEREAAITQKMTASLIRLKSWLERGAIGEPP